jgi:hypothetical protein
MAGRPQLAEPRILDRADTGILRQPGEWWCAAVLSRAPAVNIWIRRNLKMARLQGKVAFITGAGSGIARAAARLFAQEGARIGIAELKPELGRAANN